MQIRPEQKKKSKKVSKSGLGLMEFQQLCISPINEFKKCLVSKKCGFTFPAHSIGAIS
jgi:hypothetical protein